MARHRSQLTALIDADVAGARENAATARSLHAFILLGAGTHSSCSVPAPTSRFAGSTTRSWSWVSTSATAFGDTIAASKQGFVGIAACHPRLICGDRREILFPHHLGRKRSSAHFSFKWTCRRVSILFRT